MTAIATQAPPCAYYRVTYMIHGVRHADVIFGRDRKQISEIFALRYPDAMLMFSEEMTAAERSEFEREANIHG